MSKVARFMAAALAATPLLGSAAQVAAEPGGTIGKPQQMQVHSRPRPEPPGALPATPLHPQAEAGLALKYSGKPIDVLTYHYDHWRTGWNQSEADLTPATVASAKFGLLKTLNVDGLVLAQPLLVSKFTMADGKVHDVLLIATGHNSVYAYDARTYHLLWQVNLGPSQSTEDVGCGDVHPEFGIAATPVVVRSGAGATVYVVAATEPASFEFHAKLHALNLATGADVLAPREIAPKAKLSNGHRLVFDGQNQWDRAALTYANGSIYVAIGSHCDHNAGNISGWMLRYDPSLQPMGAFNTIDEPSSYELASFWMTGFGPATNAAGELFAITGNGENNVDTGGHDYGEAVLRLPADVSGVSDNFTPDNVDQLNNGDTDFGSGGLMLIPPVRKQAAPPMAVAVGKDSVMYLLNADNLGGRSTGNANVLQSVSLNSGIWGGPAWYGASGAGTVFLQTGNDVIRSYTVNNTSHPSLTQASQGTTSAGYGGSLPIVSSNGKTAGTGVVWVVRRMHDVQLEAYDAANLGAPIYAATAGVWNTGSNNAFVTAMEANGRVYVGTVNEVTVFGLTP